MADVALGTAFAVTAMFCGGVAAWSFYNLSQGGGAFSAMLGGVMLVCVVINVTNLLRLNS